MKNLEIHNTGAQITPKIRGQLGVQKKLLMEEQKQEAHPEENAGRRQRRRGRNKTGV